MNPSSSPTAYRQAVVCAQLGGPDSLRLAELPVQSLEQGQVRVRLTACGVNFPDLLMTRGKYQLRPELPFIPGMEAAGRITEIGAGVSGFVPGDRVTVTARTGLYTTDAVVPVESLVAAPANFSDTECACYHVAAHTARHALVDRARVQPGETVLVLGAGGGVGLAAVQIAGLLGARVIAAASSVLKLDAARGRGATDTVDYRAGDLVEQVRALAPQGVDVIFDPVGGALFEQALRLPAWDARVLVVGFASGSIGNAPANRPLIKGFSIIGVRAGEAMRRNAALAERSRRELADWCARGHLKPLLQATFPLSAAAAALQQMEQRNAIGRIALVPAREEPSSP